MFRVMKMISRMEPLSTRLGVLGLFNSEKRGLWADLIADFWYLKKPCKKDEDRLFSWACSDRTSINVLKLKDKIQGRYFIQQLDL